MNKTFKKQKTLGVLGGMGPYSTVHFYKILLDLTPAKKDWDHLRILIDSNVKIPSRTRAVLYNEPSPAPEMIKSINSLSRIGVDFVLVPCNSAHYFYDEVAPQIDITWLDMIEIVSNNVFNLGMIKPLILGGYVTTNKQIYSKYLPKAKYLDETSNRIVEQIIEEIKSQGNLSDRSKNDFHDLIKNNIGKIDSIIFACTELPIVFQNDEIFGLRVFDSSNIYAEKAINYAYKSNKHT